MGSKGINVDTSASTLPSINFGNLIDSGRKFIDSYLSTNQSGPLMIPPAPIQKHIDHYNEEDLKVKRKKDYDEKRIDNEAECAIYRALENLNNNIIVIHGFSYSKDQWDTLFCNTEERGREGEHDFVVIGPDNSLIYIEVKRSKSKNYSSLYRDASRQANNCGRFMKALVANHNPELTFNELKFCAFPLTSRKDGINSNIKEHEDVPILWKDDIGPSLSQYLSNSHNAWGLVSDVTALIVGLWLENQKKKGKKEIGVIWDVIGHTIRQTNDQLKSQELYMKSLHRSCNLKPVPKDYKKIFKDYLHGIEYVTEEQMCLLELCKENETVFNKPYVLVNGCAGSGKTLLMYARILKLLNCLKDDEQILLLLPWWDAAEVFMKMINKFDENITMKKMDLVGYLRKIKDEPEISDSFAKKMNECTEKVVIFVRPNFILRDFMEEDLLCTMHSIFLATLKERKWHIFCDDFHSSFAHSMLQSNRNLTTPTAANSYNIEPLADFLLNLLTKKSFSDKNCLPKSLWISCDLMQTVQFSFWSRAYDKHQETIDKIYGLFEEQPNLLSVNLRNAHGIALILYDLKEKFLKQSGENYTKLTKILPSQGSCHFIQGFTTKLYCVTKTKMEHAFVDRVKSIITKEFNLIDRSYKAAEISNMMAVIPVYHHVSVVDDQMSGASYWSKIIQALLKEIATGDKVRTFDKDLHFADYVKYANSMEFPCAVLVVDLSCSGEGLLAKEMNSWLMNILSHLYVGISRARVYCSIILICSDDEPNELYKEVHQLLLPHVKVIEDH